MSTFSKIMAVFGYVKIPSDAINLIKLIEAGLMVQNERVPESKQIAQLCQAAHTLKRFLQTGRLITR